MINLAIFGITGRMGRALLRALPDAANLKLTGALASPRNPAIGRDVGELNGAPACGVRASADRDQALEGAQVAIDFTLAPAVEDNVRACERRRCALVIGATGLSQAALKQIEASAERVPILVSPNMSIGVSLLERLVAEAARVLGDDFDVEILDTHHRDKADAPSGTALRLGETIASARGIEFAKAQILARQGHTGPRERGKIGFAVVRAGDHAGEHTVMFSGRGETLSLTHRATERLIFARGALHAAQWLVEQRPGLYSMQDITS
ncbi:MAG TPA: 4-hydroxy-tetrahydrodipicolinate reductase [Steroidobacteraceae bacterium]|nr:4-hydroxy-tetrahydrodipicolinate reductase [Steroidobacteraceae bacterium]